MGAGKITTSVTAGFSGEMALRGLCKKNSIDIRQFSLMIWAVVGAGSRLPAERDLGWLPSAEHTVPLVGHPAFFSSNPMVCVSYHCGLTSSIFQNEKGLHMSAHFWEILHFHFRGLERRNLYL